jgi:hypothetical protein
MSGFEIAGVVLGAIPLVISAIEHYESSLDRAKVFFKWQDVLEKARRDLWVQYLSYEMTLRILLVDLASEAEVEELLSEPQSTLWDNPELIQGLRDKLGATYKVYVHTIKQMEGCIKTLARHLDIDRRDATSADDLEAILEANRPVPGSQQQGHVKFEFRRRIKLTIKRRDIRQLLSSIKGSNDQLDLFITKARNVEQASPLQSAQKRSKFSLSMPLQQVYDHAAHLHQVLCKAWACGVHASHRAHLLLEHRMVRKGRKKPQLRTYGGSNSQEREQANFTLAFKGTGDADAATWYLAEFRVLDEPVLPPR